jgi:glycosyltransferase involved in cell wall biosynthesis
MGHTPAIKREYLKASLLAHPAEHEGWGLAVTEALAAGVPAIGFEECPGVNQLIRHGVNGILVSGGAEALAEALARLMRDERSRLELARAAPDTVRDYQPEKVFDLWEELLHESTGHQQTV